MKNYKRLLARIFRYHMIRILRGGVSVSLFASWECNYHCDYCLLRTNTIYPESKLLSFDSWKEFLTTLDEALRNSTKRGIGEIGLLGGEPTLLPYFVDLCHWILFEKRWQLVVYTNMSNLKMLEVEPSLLLRVEATYHPKANPTKFHDRYKAVDKIHRVIPRELLTDGSKGVIPYTHKDLACAEEKDKDKHCGPFIRIAPDQTITLKYSDLCLRNTTSK